MFKQLLLKFAEWRRKKSWHASLQLEYFTIQLQEDQRWLAHVPGVMSISQRYLNLIQKANKAKYAKLMVICLNDCLQSDLVFFEYDKHPVFSKLYQRWFDMLSDDWENKVIKSISDFRTEIDCDPIINLHFDQSKSQSYSHFCRVLANTSV